MELSTDLIHTHTYMYLYPLTEVLKYLLFIRLTVLEMCGVSSASY